MPTRNVVLTDHLAGVVDGLVRSGRYQNASEAIREGVRLLERKEEAEAALLARIMVGYGQAERGEFVEGDAREALERSLAGAMAKWKVGQAERGPGVATRYESVRSA